MTETDQGSALVTVVFVDLEGSTALVERLGDEAGTAALRTQLDALRERIEPYGGREVKSLGDGLMLAFSSPRSAVGFALASQRALAGTTPRVRIGINTGEVLVGAGDPVGGAVNAAARIADRADGGEVLVSEVVRQLVGSTPAVHFVDRGRCRLKGFPDRWRLYAVVDRPVDPVGVATVGRTDELLVVEALLASTASGTGRALVLEGEAGIGKTHLVKAAIEGARRRGIRVLEAAADELERRPASIVHGLLDGIAASLPARHRLVELLATRADNRDGVDLGYAVIEATVDLIESEAGVGPLLIAIEDLHWADDLSLRVVAALARHAGPSPISILATCRPVPRPPLLDRVMELVTAQDGWHRRLEALADIDVLALASAQTGAAAAPALRARLAQTAGNPLYITELLRSLDDDGLLRVEGGIVEVTAESLPADLRTTLIRRLSWLPADVVELLRLASLLGGSFTLRDLATITGHSVVDVAARLQDASQAGLVIGDGDRLAFRHDLIREAIYTDMAPAVRSDLHRAAGQALASQHAPVTQIAQQFALGARPGDLDAVDWLEQAGSEVLAVSPSGSIIHFEQALELAPIGWPGRAALQVRLIEPLAGCGRFDDAEAVARAVLADTPEPAVEFAALRGLSAVLGNRGDIAAAIDALYVAADAPGAPSTEPRLLRCLAGQLSILMGSRAEDARRAAEDTLLHAMQTGDEGLTALAHQTLGVAAAVSGYDEDALAHMTSAAALLESGRLPWNPYLIADFWVALCLTVLDRLDEAARAAEKVRVRAERQGSTATMPYGYILESFGLAIRGQFEDASTSAQSCLTMMDETGSYNFVLYAEAILASMAIRRGDLVAAAAHLASGGQRLVHGAPFGADMLFGTQVELLVAQGQDEAALTVAAATWAQTAPIRYLFGPRRRAVLLVHLAVAAGRADLARDVTEAMEEGARRSPALSAAAAARACRGLFDRNPAALNEACALYRKTPLRPDLAACCEDAAEVLAEQDRREEAVELLDEAAAIHIDTGASGDLVRVDALLRRLGTRRRRQQQLRPTTGWEALTRMERQVTVLVAEGLTNPEIGTRLYISRRTVETHLSHVFAKIGVSSRAQVAAEFARREA